MFRAVFAKARESFDVYSLFRQADGLRLRLEHVPNKLLDFFDEDMLQLLILSRVLIDQRILFDRDALEHRRSEKAALRMDLDSEPGSERQNLAAERRDQFSETEPEPAARRGLTAAFSQDRGGLAACAWLSRACHLVT